MASDVIIQSDALEWLSAAPERSVQFTMFSPPYALKTKRYPGARQNLKWDEWAEWMAEIVAQACRVTDGWVIVNCKNPVLKGEELPATDWLRIQARRMGCKLERPVIWHKNSVSNSRDWWVNDWEPLLAFYWGKRARPSIWNWQAIASPPKFKRGGRYSHRESNGERKKNGSVYPQTELARPRDVLRVTVGGGHMGSKLASENEAPYPEAIVRPFVRALSNPGDIVLDPFVGSGTTCAVAMEEGRSWLGIDVRASEVALALRRMDEMRTRMEASK